MSKPREPSSTFYARFMEICKKNGVKPTPLIKSLGLSTGNLKKWSEGSTVNSDIVKKLAAYFGVSPGYFFSEDEEQPIAGSALDKLCKSAGGGE